MSKRPILSVVSPFYKAAGCVDEFVARARDAVKDLDVELEIILVEDGSPDETWKKIRASCDAYPEVRAARLSRNFGQQAAILAGLKLSRGEFVVLMDCDLEHDPSYISQLYAKCLEGHDIVYAKQGRRAHGALKNAEAAIFYKALSLISPYKMDPRMQNFSILRRKVVDAYVGCTQYEAAYLQTLDWLGFDSTTITVDNNQRFSGKSTYSFSKAIVHALNITIAYSDRLLLVSAFVGAFFSMVSLVAIAVIFYRYFAHDVGVEGWASLMVAVMFFGGVILSALGVLGLYIGKIFDQTKNLPRYLIAEQIGFGETDMAPEATDY